MEDDAALPQANAVDLAAQIVSAYVSNNAVRVTDLPEVIAGVHAALTGLGKAADPADAVEKPTPAQIRNSVTPDHLISFIDGKPYKTLKRHLRKHGLDPYSYRQRYGLPADYPMVAANYSAQRSELAGAMGLGQQRRKSAGEPAPSSKPKGGRKPKGAGQAEA
ncbi:MucR family transcriptional regulator [Methylobacterium nigriterrae]|uniref:MucR family transcriptional regulator n=1 Tax=Methylobacterium nigriterrae TaxID=3127512 RepID=UPI003013954F